MSVGANIKKRRFELRMSQQELADAMGYKTRSTIAKIESGENDVSQKKLQKFAEILDTSVEMLIAGYAPSPILQEATQDNKKNKTAVIILAGGKTGRNRQNIPNQFINVQGKPIIVYSMEVYQSHPLIDDIYVVSLKGWENIVEAYAAQYGITKLCGIFSAGSSGVLSLKNAFDQIKGKYKEHDFIFIQEATRPQVRVETISRLIQVCNEKESATICHSMKDYVQFDIASGKAKKVNRDTMIALQSPEVHQFSKLKKVFQKAEQHPGALMESCCTMLMYKLGYNINFVQSSINNIKIAREEDLAAFSAQIKE